MAPYLDAAAGAEAIYQFFHGAVIGTVWSLVTPYPPPGSAAAMRLASLGTFRPAPPLALLSTIPSNAIMFGCVLGYQRLSIKVFETWSGGKDTLLSRVVGMTSSALYCYFFLSAPSRMIMMHNRIMGSTVATATIYACLFDISNPNWIN